MKFWKYQGAGNDFVMLDQREHQWLMRENTEKIARLCDRRFGIGADGLILLQNRPGYDFEMIYFNADGRESTMCGNGGRCIAAFAQHLGVIGSHGRFWAIDGEHEAFIAEKQQKTDVPESSLWVELKMSDVEHIGQEGNVFVLNTGSPHYVRFEDDLRHLDMVQEGRAVRYSERFKNEGINVNLVRMNTDGSLDIRTYERGVEDETLACGTGVTAAALASYKYLGLKEGQKEIAVHAQGGDLSVRFKANDNGAFSDIWLCGPAELVFEGNIQF
ncbi:MAG TPA: diaminopimelate epimerase [Saprospiraceae bacterium]|nr:diaminopimelate epimerase [Saprospiraceae bacterium]